METFGCYECFFAEFIAVGVTEDDTGEWCTAKEDMSIEIIFEAWNGIQRTDRHHG